MVHDQLEGRGITNRRVLDAMRGVPRHLFVPDVPASAAYDDRALPIGEGQTISQPYMVASMTEALAAGADARVLEIGTGSGYQAAVLSRLAREVVTIERKAGLAALARDRLTALGFTNVTVVDGDGSDGFPPQAPYGGILVTAGAPVVPAALKEQLENGARLVVPVGSRLVQRLTIVERHGDVFAEIPGESCVFVPLIGSTAWQETD